MLFISIELNSEFIRERTSFIFETTLETLVVLEVFWLSMISWDCIQIPRQFQDFGLVILCPLMNFKWFTVWVVLLEMEDHVFLKFDQF